MILSIDTANKPDLDTGFTQKLGVTFPIILDDKNVSRGVYKILGTPTNLLIDREGKIVFRHLGFAPGGEKVLDAEVEAMVKGLALQGT